VMRVRQCTDDAAPQRIVIISHQNPAHLLKPSLLESRTPNVESRTPNDRDASETARDSPSPEA
jgi:hypothetical protein